MEEEKQIEELGKAPEQEVKVWGLGVLLNKFDKLLEKVEKIDKKLFFLEQRQQKVAELEHPELKKSY